MEDGLTAQRIYQDLVLERGFTGSYDSVKRYVRAQNSKCPVRKYRMECPPAEEAQVDFGTGAPLVDQTGKRRKTHVFRIVLSHSRKGYSEAVTRQDTETFIRCLENAFRAFGGVPQTLCTDNLKAAVIRADWYDPDLNPKIRSFCEHYGTTILPTRPRTPEHKGKVESSVGYVQSNALKARTFGSLAEQNTFLRNWERQVADCRIHGTTRKQVRKLFEQEKPLLLSLPMDLFPCFSEGKRRVHRDGYVEVAKAYYEVPAEYIGRDVWVRWDDRLVRIFNKELEQITILARRAPGQFSSCLGPRGRMTTIERDAAFWLGKAARMGDSCGEWALAVMSERGPHAIRLIQGLLAMRKKYTTAAIGDACKLALSHGAYRLRDLRELIKRPVRQDNFEFMAEHPLIRDMDEYRSFLDAVNEDTFQRKESYCE
jgi:transposase